jgi:hypothetical protein
LPEDRFRDLHLGMYAPSSPELIVLRSRVSDSVWEKRVADAREAQRLIQAVIAEMDLGRSQNEAIDLVLPKSKRSWATRRLPRFRARGFEGLFDTRLPREPEAARRIARKIAQEAAIADPASDVAKVIPVLQERGIQRLPSPATIRKELARAGAIVQREEKKRRAEEEIVDLPFAGGEFLLAAESETGAIAALAREVSAIAEEARAASEGLEPSRDTNHRNDRGRFTQEYNRRRRRQAGEEVAAYLRTAEEKAEGRVPSWPRFVHEREATIEAKLRMLVFEPIVSRTKGWDGLRSPDAAGLATLAPYAYMPSTLAKFTSALAIANAGSRLLDVAGRCWHEVGVRTGKGGAMAALYVDNHAKEVWTDFLTKAAKVSHLNRIMPAITTTYVHTGAGTPLVVGTQSGSAPLAPQLPDLVKRAEAVLGDGVRRAVVIDSEGSTFDILAAFAKDRRVIVTPLKPSRTPELELTYSPGSYYRRYRENDEIRIAQATLRHRSTGRQLEIGALLIRRPNRQADIVLLTTGLAEGIDGRALADLYFARWPVQENWFKKAGALKLDQHRGNCSRMVTNIAVVTEYERLQARLGQLEERRRTQVGHAREREVAAGIARHAYERANASLTTRRRRLDSLLAGNRTHTKAFTNAAADHLHRLAEVEALEDNYRVAQREVERARAAVAKMDADIAKAKVRLDKLGPMRRIRQLDVAQDTILTATKLTGTQLILYASAEYLPGLKLTPQTFIARVFSLKGRRELRVGEETVVFYRNDRDRSVTTAVEKACRTLNARNLSRDGRRLRYVLEDEPATKTAKK